MWSTGAVVFVPALFLVLVCLAVGAWGLATAALWAVKRRRARVVRSLALVSLALGVGGYALGIVVVAVAHSEASHGADSSPAHECRQPERGLVTGHRAGYFPLQFDCVREDGTTFPAGFIPWWLTPVAVVLTAGGAWVRADPLRRPATRVG